MTPECSCGEPATQEVRVGRRPRGGKWVVKYEPMCPEYADESNYELEAGRSS